MNTLVNGENVNVNAGPADAKSIAQLEQRVMQLEREKTEAMASVGAFVVEREKLRAVNAEIEAAFDELYSRHEALQAEQQKSKENEANAHVEREKLMADMDAREDEIMRLESELAELRKRRLEDAGKVEQLRDGLDETVAAQIKVQQDKWRSQVQEVVQAYQEENLELEVFNDVLKAKSKGRSIEAASRADQVAALVLENEHLRQVMEMLCTQMEAMNAGEKGTGIRHAKLPTFEPVPQRL